SGQVGRGLLDDEARFEEMSGLPSRKPPARIGSSGFRDELAADVAYFRSRDYSGAAQEFSAVVERAPANDYAHFCLGRSLEKLGDRSAASRHLSLAYAMSPDRSDYRLYKDRLRAA
ncbi:hypothetical protein LCGC14_2548410, partial [marine sediment metagenome]